MCTVPVLSRVCLESYNDPRAVYECLKRRGMDLVTVTDHDSIEAAESLRRFPDFFLSEEVTCTTPAGGGLHVGIYNITERDHVEVQRRRTDLEAMAAYLTERNILFAVNHVFSALTGARYEDDFDLFHDLFPAMETLNGQLMPRCNRAAGKLAALWGKIGLAGSDAHTMETLGLTYTEIRGARSTAEFVEGLKRRGASPGGRSGSFAQLTRAVWGIGAGMMRTKPWTSPVAAPLALAVPLVTLGCCVRDLLFVQKWSRRLCLDGFCAYPLRPQEEEV
jgi:predicted metal-dependent phosphoesterase TrpH